MKSRRTSTKSLDSFSVMEVLCFTVAWSPPISDDDRRRFPRWESWSDFFKDYDSIRPLLVVSRFHKRGVPLFADTVREALAAAQLGEVWEKHRHSGLQHAHLYQRGDGHVHDGFEARLGPAVELSDRAISFDG